MCVNEVRNFGFTKLEMISQVNYCVFLQFVSVCVYLHLK